jgi:hypothetical protein
MGVRSKKLFENISNAINFELDLETKLTRKAKPFTLKKGIMYKVGQDNKMCKCLTTSKTQIVLKELHEGMARRHFATYI